MKYKRGCRVAIVGHRTPKMNYEGWMDQYLNTIMTVNKIKHGSRADTYKMIEDDGEWFWNDNMIDHAVTAAKFNSTYKKF